MFGSHRSKKDMVRHPQQITTADTALDDDMRSRIIKYSITMGIRTACFVAAYFAFAADLHVIMWICVAGAVVLPYPAVIFANAGRERTQDDAASLLDEAPLDELPPARGETISADTIDGETVDEETVDDARPAPDEDRTGATDGLHEGEVPDGGHGETVMGETVPEDDEDAANAGSADSTRNRGDHA